MQSKKRTDFGIPQLDKIQENLLRFRYMDNSLHFLVEVCEQSKSPFALSMLHKYACIDLISFLEHYNSFLSSLHEKEKKLVLCMKYFIKEIFENKDELERTRNKWVAHVNKGDMVAELSKSIVHISAQDIIIMINGLTLFVKGLEIIFPYQTNYIIENFTKELDEIMVKSPVTNETIGIIINDKIITVNAKFLINDLNFQFDLKRYSIKSNENKTNP